MRSAKRRICFSSFLALSISSTVCAKTLTEAEKQEIFDASNYSLCQELKLRPAKGDEALIEVNCKSIIKIFELKIEKAALLKRLNGVNAEIKKAEVSKVELP